jgi:hypothetical protein
MPSLQYHPPFPFLSNVPDVSTAESMIRIEKNIVRLQWAAITGFLAFFVGYIQHRWFYPLEFHGDSAAVHVLAKAILEQHSLLPADFYYGNQIIFLRSSPFIALASLFGFVGIEAFSVGSSLSIAFWGVVLYVFLSALFASNRKAALFSVLLLVPFGAWDSDLVLGQQSHLANAILALGLVVFASLHAERDDRRFLVGAVVCLFVMSSESPIRGLLVLAPVLVSFMLVTGRKRTVDAARFLGPGFVLAFLLNKWLVHLRPISVNYFHMLSSKSTDDILSNLERTSRETLGSVSAINIVAGETLSLTGLMVLGAGLLLIMFYAGFFLSGLADVVKTAAAGIEKRRPPDAGAEKRNGRMRFARLTSVLGLVVGALAVAALNPDSSRHYLWTMFLAKLFFLIWSLDLWHRHVAAKNSVPVLAVLALLMSSWFAVLVKLHWHPTKAIDNRNANEAIASIEEIARKTKISYIYGEDFWRMMPLNTFVSDINAQSLFLDGAELHPFNWLTMPSWHCAKGDVLYYLKDGKVDAEIQKRLVAAGGAQVKSGTAYSIWKGPRVWQLSGTSGCP